MNLFLALFTVANLFRGEHHFYSDILSNGTFAKGIELLLVVRL